jgi:hypothetical protein
MPVSKEYLGVKGDECQCGRRMSIRHCTKCGSTRTYSRMNRMHEHLDGSRKHVDIQFRCQGCGHLYIEEEREFCEAPPAGAKLALRRAAALAESIITGSITTGVVRLPTRPVASATQLSSSQTQSSPKAMSKEEFAHEVDRIKYKLRVQYTDMKIEGYDFKGESVNQYVDRRLKELEEEIANG